MAQNKTRSELPLAIQLYSVRSLLKDNFQETLRSLANTGFIAVELFGGQYGNMAPEQLAAFFSEIGIKTVGMHCSKDGLLDKNSLTYNYARALQCEFLTLSLPTEVQADVTATAETLKRIGAIVAGEGFTLTYHNHAAEFIKLPDGRIALDALFEATSGSDVQFLFDTFFAACSGFDPKEYLKQFAGRVPQIHFNDMADASKVDPGRDGMGLSTELGAGSMDLPAIYRTALNTGVRWVILEQHALRDNPLESAQANFNYYHKMIAATAS